MNTNNEGESKIRKVIHQMVLRKGVAETEREAEEGRVYDIVEAKIRDRIIRALPLEKLEELNRLLDDENFPEEKFDEIIESANLDLGEIAKQSLTEFLNEYLKEEVK